MAVRPFGLPKRQDTAEWVALAQQIAILVEMQVKHLLHLPRPVNYSEKLQPVIDTPDHSSYPSGHATEAFAIATVLNRLEFNQDPSNAVKKGRERQVFLLAHRIAVNRTIAGVHFPIDSMAGAVLGCGIGEAIVALSKRKKIKKYKFTASRHLWRDRQTHNFKNDDFTLQKMRSIIKIRARASHFHSMPSFVRNHWNLARRAWTENAALPPAWSSVNPVEIGFESEASEHTTDAAED